MTNHILCISTVMRFTASIYLTGDFLALSKGSVGSGIVDKAYKFCAEDGWWVNMVFRLEDIELATTWRI